MRQQRLYVIAEFAVRNLIASVCERGAIVASVGHGYCGILNVRLSDGSYLVNGNGRKRNSL